MSSLLNKLREWISKPTPQDMDKTVSVIHPLDDSLSPTKASEHVDYSTDLPETKEYGYPGFAEILKEPGPLFITGQAGTGKSTLVRKLVSDFRESGIRAAVVAPTGIAALNSKGETIHSLFKFPPRFVDYKTLSGAQPDILSVLDYLIIDEVSMVRADMMDCIHVAFCLSKKIADYANAPFCGGVKVIFVGDLYQLPPVVKGDLEQVFTESGEWKSPWFFDAHCLVNRRIPCIELTEVYRLSNEEGRDKFLSTLGKIRSGEVDASLLNFLHTESSESLESPVYLTGTRLKAEEINLQELNKIEAHSRDYVGRLEGSVEFKEQDFPSPMQLTLKVGAQVMITKNIPEKGLINGMMGIIEEMGREVIAIKIRRESGNSELVTIKESGWTQFKHVFNREKRQIDPKEIGTFFQFPLKLGWAITVHKSQGLTLPAATISIDRAFACGQIYVALSRVRRLKDLSFSKPLRIHDVQCDSRVTHFLNSRVDYKLGVG